MKLQQAFAVEVEAVDPKTSVCTMADAACFLPHVMFSSLGTGYPEQFQHMFGVSGAEAFWKSVEKQNDPRLLNHPIARDSKVLEKRTTIPLFVHGDGVEFRTRDSLMCWSWGGLLCPLSSLQSHLLLASWPKSATSSKTWQALDELVSWSFEALLKGQHPRRLPNGEALPKGSFMEEVAGQPLVPGTKYMGVIWSLQGDQEFFCNTLGLPH